MYIIVVFYSSEYKRRIEAVFYVYTHLSNDSLQCTCAVLCDVIDEVHLVLNFVLYSNAMYSAIRGTVYLH